MKKSNKRTSRLSLHAAEQLEPRIVLSNQGLVINEFMATNKTTLVDSFGDSSDWIEIHNDSDAEIDLAGWHLSDDTGEVEKWTFPSVKLPADGYLVVFASGKDQTNPEAELHTNFKLKKDGESLSLANPANEVKSSFAPTYPIQTTDVSYGVSTDGEAKYFKTPTPGQANVEGIQIAASVTASQDSQFFETAFELELATTEESATIRYTTDGSVPTAENGTEYSGPISITQPTVLRAATFREGYDASEVLTRSFLSIDATMNQTNENVIARGLPSSWGNRPADYAMDPAITGIGGADEFEGRYASELRDSLNSIPSLSLVASQDELFGADGIYSNPESRGSDFEKAVNGQILGADSDSEVQFDAGIRIQGGISRSVSTKNSLRLAFRSEYGATKLRHNLFGEEAASEFNSITLRSSGGEVFTGVHYIRDGFARASQRATGSASPNGRWLNLYINGVYWGVYEAVERPDSQFMANYYGGVDDDWDVINPGDLGDEKDTAIDGDLDAWNRLLAMSKQMEDSQDPAEQQALFMMLQGKNPDGTDNAEFEHLLDVDNYADYLLTNWYLNNGDWPHRNYYMGRDRGPDSTGFKFIVWDAEFTLDDLGQTDPQSFSAEMGPARIFQGLYKSESFRVQFSDRVQKHFGPGGAYYVNPESPEFDASRPEDNVPAARYDQFVQEFIKPLVAESARWGDELGGFGGFESVTPDSEFGDDPHGSITDATATPIVDPVIGELVSYIDFSGDVDVFQFVAVRDTFAVVDQGETPLSLTLLDSLQVAVVSEADGLGINYSVNAGETYYLRVEAADATATGEYRLFYIGEDGGVVSPNPDSELGEDPHPSTLDNNATPLGNPAIGEIISFIDSAGDVDVFQFVAPTNTFSVFNQGGMPVAFSLFDSGQIAVVGEDTQGSEARFAVQAGETYFIKVEAEDAAAIGEYALFYIGEENLIGDGGGVGGPDVGGPGVGGPDVGGPDVGGPDVGGPDVGGPGVVELGVGGPGAGGGTKLTRDEIWLPRVQEHFKFLESRSESLTKTLTNDDLYREAPAFNLPQDMVRSQADQLAITAQSGDVYYTLDGTDPRNPDGSVSATAAKYSDSLSLTQAVQVTARSLDNGKWSAVQRQTYLVANQADATSLRFSEIHYHPADASTSEQALGFNDKDDFEFVEFVNTSDSTIDLTAAKLIRTNQLNHEQGVAFDFSESTHKQLAPGEAIVVVENVDAFRARYGNEIRIAGQWKGKLDNGKETLRLDVQGLTIQEVSYDDAWHPDTDGGEKSLEIRNATSNDLTSWNQDTGWIASPAVGGSPGLLRAPHLGDFDGDGSLTANDIDRLYAAISEQSKDTAFDVNADGELNNIDASYMIKTLLNTRRGDVNLDGTVDFADFLVLSVNFGTKSGWAAGDFDGNNEVNFDDFQLLALNFGFDDDTE